MMDPISLDVVAQLKTFTSLEWLDAWTLRVGMQGQTRPLIAAWNGTQWIYRIEEDAPVGCTESNKKSTNINAPLPDPRISEINGRAQIYWRESLFKPLADYTDVRALAVSPDERYWAIHAAAPALVPQIVIYDTQTQKLHLIATALNFNPRPNGAAPVPVQWTSKDGAPVYGWYYTPEVRSHLKPPLIVLVHDGPHICVRETWPIKARLLTSRGYAVLYVNYRGSTGYGYEHEHGLAGYWGERDVWDVITGRRHLVERGWVDPHRTAVWGGRFGGATVLNILGRAPGTFQAAIAVYPLCDLAAAIHRADAKTKEKWVHLMGTRSMEEMTPLARAHSIQDPLAVFHGGKDPFITSKEIEAFVEKVPGEKQLKIYPELGEKFIDAKEWRDYYEHSLQFLASHLHPERHQGHWYRDYSYEIRLFQSPLLRGGLIVLSSLFLILAVIGIFLPLLPTTPFVLLAAACYARSSARFYNRLMNQKYLGPPLRQWKATHTIPRPVKLLAIALLMGTLVPSTLLFVPIAAVQAGLILFAVIMSVIIARIPSRRVRMRL